VSGLAFESHAAAMDTLPPGCPLYAHNPSQMGNGCAPSSPRRNARDGGGSDEQGFRGVSDSFCRGRCAVAARFFVDACKALQQAVGWPADIEL
jgi:hypothetical protein